jgi:ribosomal-protein-alanine N-acetyltransferase
MTEISDSVIIKNLFTGHIRQIVEIEKQCFIDPWTEDWFEAFILSDEISWGVYINKKLVAYLFAVWNEDTLHLVNIAVKADNRRRGIAKALLEKLYKIALQRKIEYISLEVRRSNLAAIDFYKSEGFLLAGERIGYYQGVEDALIFRKEL